LFLLQAQKLNEVVGRQGQTHAQAEIFEGGKSLEIVKEIQAMPGTFFSSDAIASPC
jgi:hypothetical protein